MLVSLCSLPPVLVGHALRTVPHAACRLLTDLPISTLMAGGLGAKTALAASSSPCATMMASSSRPMPACKPRYRCTSGALVASASSCSLLLRFSRSDFRIASRTCTAVAKCAHLLPPIERRCQRINIADSEEPVYEHTGHGKAPA